MESDSEMLGKHMGMHVEAHSDDKELLRNVTGLVDLKAVVKKFESQMTLKKNLTKSINEAERRIQNLRKICFENEKKLEVVKSNRDASSQG